MRRYILSQVRRNVIVNISFCVLLALAGALLCLGSGLLITALRSAEDIGASFTTIALPDTSAMRKYAFNKIESEGITEYGGHPGFSPDDPVWGPYFKQLAADYMADEILKAIEENVYGSAAVEMDPRRLLGAYSPEIVPNLPAEAGIFWSNNSAAFIVSCTGIEEVWQIIPETTERRYVAGKQAYVDFDVIQTVALHPDIKPPDTLWVTLRATDEDGGYFFKEGETYFISGNSYNTSSRKFAGESDTDGFGTNDATLLMDFFWEGAQTVTGSVASMDDLSEPLRRELEARTALYTVTEDDFPMDIVSYRYMGDNTRPPSWFRLDTDYQDALKSEIGADMEYAVSAAEKDIYRLNVLTTDNLNSYFRFNQYRASIEAGRNFTEEETAAGARVCIIPSNLAKKNNLGVGDIITLHITEGQSHVTIFLNDPNSGNSSKTWLPGGYSSHMAEAGPIAFEIIGVYNTHYPKMDAYDPHAIPMNAIFIPDNSFDGSLLIKREETPEYFGYTDLNPLLNVIIVPNGENEEFRQAINNLIPGYGNFFMIYDQGYSFVKNAVLNLRNGARLIFVLALSGWIISALVFCLFFVSRKKKEAGLLFALGVSKKHRFAWVFAQCVIVIIIAQAAAFGASAAFYDNILEYAVEAAENDALNVNTEFSDAAVAADGAKRELILQHDSFAVPVAAIAQMVLLFLLAGGISAKITKRGAVNLREAGG